MKYDFQGIEAKWQQRWDDEKSFKTLNDYSMPKYYALVEFPYPSGAGLHVGHPRSNTAMDIIARNYMSFIVVGSILLLTFTGWDRFVPTFRLPDDSLMKLRGTEKSGK